MKVGALNGIYPGKYFKRMEKLQGLQGVNRERMKFSLQNLQLLGGQIFASTSAASTQKSVLIAEQMRLRVENEHKALASRTTSLNILV